MKTNKFKIIILGANSHIAKGLIYNFFKNKNSKLYFYTTDKQKANKFVESLKVKRQASYIINNYNKNFVSNADLIINCIGVGTPKQLNGQYNLWFDVLEHFDNLCIEYIKQNKKCLYIHFSSGTIYGSNFVSPANFQTTNNIFVNKIDINNFYSISKLYSEAKHRSFDNLKIVDLRVFSYFSRFANLEDGYFLSDIINSIKNKTELIVNEQNIVRDYIHHSDLYKIVLKLMKYININDSFDLISKAPINKKDILNFFVKHYGLKYKIKNNLKFTNSSGTKNYYYSKYNKLKTKLKFEVKYSSLESLITEAKDFLKSKELT